MGKTKLFAHQPRLFEVFKSIPKLEDRFRINLIGKGYPSPNRLFRWCTERLKINPTNDYIKRTVSEYGKAIIMLGTRRAESTNRAKSMDRYDPSAINETQRLRKHSLANAWVFGPIADLSTQEVWTYLLQVPNFWGGDNKRLVTMYRNGSDQQSECPLLIDTSTASCGNSRFGCWTCTVVDKDKSMTNLIENGEDWMLPLLEFRNVLAEIRHDPAQRMTTSRDNKERVGPWPSCCGNYSKPGSGRAFRLSRGMNSKPSRRSGTTTGVLLIRWIPSIFPFTTNGSCKTILWPAPARKKNSTSCARWPKNTASTPTTSAN